MGGLQRAQGVEVDVFGAADLGNGAHLGAGMHAEPGAGHEVLPQPEGEQGFGQAGNQAGDARLGVGCGNRLAEGVAHGHSGHGGRRAQTV